MAHLKRKIILDLYPDFESSPSPFFVLASQQHVPCEALLVGVRAGWCEDFNEKDPRSGMTLLMNILVEKSLNHLDVARYGSGSSIVETASPISSEERLAIELVARGADPWISCTDSLNEILSIQVDSFDQAIHMGLSHAVQSFLQHPNTPSVENLKARLNLAPWVSGQKTPYIHACVHNNRFDLMDILLSNGFDIEQKDEDGRTPLFYARNTEALNGLLKRGSNPVAQDNSNQLATQKWREDLSTAIANEMIRTLQPAMIANLSKMPEKERWPLVRERALEILQKGQKGAMVSLIKGAGLKITDLRFPPLKEGLNHSSLIYQSSMALIEEPSLAFHSVTLALQESDLSYESIPGVPDIFWAMLALRKAEKRNGLEEAQAESLKKLTALVPDLVDDSQRINGKKLRTWLTLAAIHAPHKALNKFFVNFIDKYTKGFKKISYPTLNEQEQYLTADPLVLQFSKALIEANSLSSDTFLNALNQSDSETFKTLVSIPMFWTMSLPFLSKDSGYYRSNTTSFWEMIQKHSVQPPVGCLDEQGIKQLIQTLETNNRAQPELTQAWLEKWLLQQTLQSSTVRSGKSTPKPRL